MSTHAGQTLLAHFWGIQALGTVFARNTSRMHARLTPLLPTRRVFGSLGLVEGWWKGWRLIDHWAHRRTSSGPSHAQPPVQSHTRPFDVVWQPVLLFMEPERVPNGLPRQQRPSFAIFGALVERVVGSAGFECRWRAELMANAPCFRAQNLRCSCARLCRSVARPGRRPDRACRLRLLLPAGAPSMLDTLLLVLARICLRLVSTLFLVSRVRRSCP